MRFSPTISGGENRTDRITIDKPVVTRRKPVQKPRRSAGKNQRKPSKRKGGSSTTNRTAGTQPPAFDPSVDSGLFYNRSGLLTVNVTNDMRSSLANSTGFLDDMAVAVFAVGEPEDRSITTNSALDPSVDGAANPVTFAVRRGPVEIIPHKQTRPIRFAPLTARELFSNTYYLYWSPLPGTGAVVGTGTRSSPEFAGCWTSMAGEAERPPIACNRLKLSSASFLFGRVPNVQITDLDGMSDGGDCLVGVGQTKSFDALGPHTERPFGVGSCNPTYRTRLAVPPVPVRPPPRPTTPKPAFVQPFEQPPIPNRPVPPIPNRPVPPIPNRPMPPIPNRPMPPPIGFKGIYKKPNLQASTDEGQPESDEGQSPETVAEPRRSFRQPGSTPGSKPSIRPEPIDTLTVPDAPPLGDIGRVSIQRQSIKPKPPPVQTPIKPASAYADKPVEYEQLLANFRNRRNLIQPEDENDDDDEQ